MPITTASTQNNIWSLPRAATREGNKKTDQRREISSKEESFTFFILAYWILLFLTWVLEALWQAPHRWPYTKKLYPQVRELRQLGSFNWRNPYLISLAPSVGTKFFKFTFENVVSINFCFGWSLIPISQPWPSKSRLLQPPLRNSPGRIRRWSYGFSKFNRLSRSPRVTWMKKGRAIRGVLIGDLLPRMNRFKFATGSKEGNGWDEECHEGENRSECG